MDNGRGGFYIKHHGKYETCKNLNIFVTKSYQNRNQNATEL